MPPFPMRSTAAVSLLFSLFALVTQCLDAQSPEEKKSKEGIFECYTCLGRNYENCMFGQTLCAGACWKMIDEKHELIAKGCTAEDKSDNKEESDVDTKVKLPWSPNGAETIQGTVYYCKGDWCNGAESSLQTKLTTVLLTIGFGLVGRCALAHCP